MMSCTSERLHKTIDLCSQSNNMKNPFAEIMKNLDKRLEQFAPSKKQIGTEPSFSLFSAVITGHTAKVKEMINANPSGVNTTNAQGWTPLMYVMANGCSVVATELINRGARYDRLNFDGMSALGLGGSYGHRGTIRCALSAIKALKGLGGVIEAVNQVDAHGKTPLHYAAENRQWETCTVLLEYGANPNIQDLEGNTPLMLGVKAKHAMTIRIMLQKGADPKLGNFAGEQPFNVACNQQKYIFDEFMPDDLAKLEIKNDEVEEESEEEEEEDSGNSGSDGEEQED